MKDAISYKVTVEVTIRRTETVGKIWGPVTGNPEHKYDYSPQIEKVVAREVKVLEQLVDTLDMRALVAVLNNLPIPIGTPVDPTGIEQFERDLKNL